MPTDRPPTRPHSGRLPGIDAIKSSQSLTDQTYEAILDAICEGRLQPGERLNQDELAARLEVSRQPVTQALFLLKVQGFVRETGRRGLLVAPMDPEVFRAIFQIRYVMEPLAVALGCLDEQAIVQGRALIARGRAVDERDSPALIRADMDFHLFLYELSGNSFIGQVMRQNWRHLQRAMGEVLRIPGQSAKVWNEHGAIFDLLVRGDTQAGVNAMRDHIVAAAARVAPFAMDDLKKVMAATGFRSATG